MKRVAILLVILSCSGCETAGDVGPAIMSSFSSGPLPEAECDRQRALLKYHMSPQQRAALVQRIQDKGCEE